MTARTLCCALLATALAAPASASPPQRPAPVEATRGYDVLNYTLHLALDLDARHLRGQADIRLTPTEPLSGLELDLEDLEVFGASVEGVGVGFTQAGSALYIPLEAAEVGQPLTVTVNYKGQPTLNSARLGLSIRPPAGSGSGSEDVVYTITEPDAARRWFPCNDTPSDKASLQLTVVVPDTGDSTWVVAANGQLVGEGPESYLNAAGEQVQGKAYTWAETHPIATYLIAFAAAPYVAFAPDDAEGSQVPITLFARPSYVGSARVAWARVGGQLNAMASLFGPYPFDKYGVVEGPMAFAAMEHQTLTLWQSALLLANVDSDAIGVHEIAHHWFGDLVTPSSWKDIWLNEGFATYAEALWSESEEGSQGLQTKMSGIQAAYLAYHGYDDDTSLYDPDELFGVTSYDKGAAVLHMLRFELGDEAFFAALNDYLDTFAYGNATTADLKAALEARSGVDLTSFFDTWVYAAGAPFPKVEIGWDVSGDSVEIGLRQTETGAPFDFRLPLRVTLRDDTQLFVNLHVQPAAAQRYAITVPGKVRSIAIDPERWILAEVEQLNGPPGLDCQAVTVCDADTSCADDVTGATCTSPDAQGCGCNSHRGDLPASAALLMLGVAFRRRRARAIA